MATLVTADWHLNNSLKDRYRHEFQKQLRAMVKKQHVDLAIILGDITDVKDFHGAVLVNEIADHLEQLSRLCKVIVLKGNHDYLGDPDNPFFKWLGKIPRITWINEPLHTQNLPFGNSLFLPHTRDYENDWKHVFTDRRFQWAFAHNTFQGARVGPRQLDGIPLSVFPKGVRVISGDIHYPQTVGKTLTYVGAPYTCHFGDAYDPRILLIHDDGTLQSIPCAGPQKRLVEITALKELDRIDKNPGDIIKVKYILPTSRADRWPDIKTEIREWGKEREYVIDTVIPVVEHESVLVRTKGSRKADDELVKAYAKRIGASPKTLEAGLRIIEEI